MVHKKPIFLSTLGLQGLNNILIFSMVDPHQTTTSQTGYTAKYFLTRTELNFSVTDGTSSTPSASVHSPTVGMAW